MGTRGFCHYISVAKTEKILKLIYAHEEVHVKNQRNMNFLH